jgi:D-alanine transaminase/branched-chain amino acid aminotransferase
MAKWVFINGEFVTEKAAMVPIKDLSFQRGYGVFDFFRLAENKPLFLNDHLERFFFSAQGLHLTVPYTREEIKTLVVDLIGKNNLPGTGIRLSLTGGLSEDGFNIGQPTFAISQHTFTPPTKEQMAHGIRLLSYPFQRQLPQLKTIDYLMAIWLQPLRKEKGADDLLYHHNGVISESPRSNFFLIKADNTIVTPIEGVLAGVTRKKVLQVARKHFKVVERAIFLHELKEAKEAFLTSTTKQILPVSQVDDYILSKPEISHLLLEAFKDAGPDE